MRSMESNFLGLRSESGMLMPNSASNALTRSMIEFESSKPDSKSDSSGAGSRGLAAICRMMEMILVRLSMGSGIRYLQARSAVNLVLLQDIRKQDRGQPPVSGGRQVHIVGLAQA